MRAAQILERHRLVDEVHGRGLAAVEGLAGHDVVERVALAHHLRHRLGHHAGRNDAPVDLGQSERRFLCRDREIAGDERRESAAEAPAVDHRDRRLRIEHELAPLPLRIGADDLFALRRRHLVGLAEEFLQVHAGGE